MGLPEDIGAQPRDAYSPFEDEIEGSTGSDFHPVEKELSGIAITLEEQGIWKAYHESEKRYNQLRSTVRKSRIVGLVGFVLASSGAYVTSWTSQTFDRPLERFGGLTLILIGGVTTYLGFNGGGQNSTLVKQTYNAIQELRNQEAYRTFAKKWKQLNPEWKPIGKPLEELASEP